MVRFSPPEQAFAAFMRHAYFISYFRCVLARNYHDAVFVAAAVFVARCNDKSAGAFIDRDGAAT